MKKFNQNGGATLIILLIFLVIALTAAIGFGVWAYQGRQDYKNNTDQKIATAVTNAEQAQSVKDNNAFAEKEKLPNKTFKGPDIYGSVSFSYPKTWSGYVDQSNSTEPLNGYFYPDIVPSIAQATGATTGFALRVELVSQEYSQVVKQFDTFLKKGQVRASAYVPPQMAQIPNVQTGTRFDGMIEQNIQGSMVVIKVRDKTLKIYTDSPSFLGDFNNTILNSLTFVP